MAAVMLMYFIVSALLVAGILFIARWRFYAKEYKTRYTVEVTAKVVGIKRGVLGVPLMIYEADVDGMAETLAELPAVGAPAVRFNAGDEVKLYLHPDPERLKTVMFTERTRPFVNEVTAPFNSLFFKLMGIGFIAAAIVLFKLFEMILKG